MTQTYACPNCGQPIELDDTLGAVCGGCDKFYAASDKIHLASAQAQYDAMGSEAHAATDAQRRQRYAIAQEAKAAQRRMQCKRAKARITLFSVMLAIFIAILVLAIQYTALQPVYAVISIVAFAFFCLQCVKTIWAEVYLLRHSR